MMQHKDSAVSPVVGVMLMLVVTIIIAAVVSAFAGGLASEQHKTPQVTISAKSVIENIGGTISPDYPYPLTYPDGYTAKNGILFENTGGDTFSLSDIAVQLQTQDTKYTITSTDELNEICILPNGTTNGGYFQKIGNTSLADVMIHPGDQFMLYADGNAKGLKYTGYDTYYGPKLSWTPKGASNGIGIYLDTKVQYAIIDRVSNKVMTKGDLVLS
jgi:hypothetical protein